MSRFPYFVVAVAGAVVVFGATFAADSATSQPGVIDSRLRTSGSAAAPLLEARSGNDSASEETFTLDTATAIGTLIMFR
jgi:hypothetical protein